MLQKLYERVRDYRSRRLRFLPPFRVVPSERRTIQYLCPDYHVPSGGIRAIYRHVDILNAAGIPAVVRHRTPGFRCSWFQNETEVSAMHEISPDDFLVVPEIYGSFINDLPPVRRILFSQNVYQTFDGLDLEDGETLSYDGFEAAMVVSIDNRRYLNFVFPDLPVFVVPNAIDRTIFAPRSCLPKKQIAYMPRRRQKDAEHLLQMLGARLDGWDVVTIKNRSETETAAILQESAIFLAFGQQEGFGLPAAEAMSCGCYVIGFSGQGGNEIFNPAYADLIEDSDLLGFAKAIVRRMAEFDETPEAFSAVGIKASAWIEYGYPPEQQRNKLLRFFRSLSA